MTTTIHFDKRWFMPLMDGTKCMTRRPVIDAPSNSACDAIETLDGWSVRQHTQRGIETVWSGQCPVGKVGDAITLTTLNASVDTFSIDAIITNVRLERVQQISILDCIREGWTKQTDQSPRLWFRDAWNHHYPADHPGSWDNDPFVWVIQWNCVPAVRLSA